MDVYICRSCGEEYSVEPEDNLCLSCFENEVYLAGSYNYDDWSE